MIQLNASSLLPLTASATGLQQFNGQIPGLTIVLGILGIAVNAMIRSVGKVQNSKRCWLF
jgi:hypothetical protein